jgi:hypothetical protein
MAKPLSEQLSNLSARAKRAEDNFAATRTEAREKREQRREQAKASAEATIQKVDSAVKSAGDKAERGWNSFQTKVDADIDSLNRNIAQKKHDIDARQAQNLADDREFEAAVAIDYALASVDQAELAVIDAVIARVDAEEAKIPMPSVSA